MKKEKKDLFTDDKVEEADIISNEDLQQMLQAKQTELNDVRNELLETQNKLRSTELRALTVHQKNQQLTAATPEIARQIAEMDFQLSMAQKFIAGKAFKCETPEQAFVLIKAGAEMGLKPVESMQMLYIVNGAVRFYGDKMVGRITAKGYKIQYLNESKEGVDVRCFHPDDDIDFDVTEQVRKTDQVFVKSKAYQFAAKNKMRFHGVRMIASFHLSHLFASVEDEFSSDFRNFTEQENSLLPEQAASNDDRKERNRILERINHAVKAKSLELLESVKGNKVSHDVVDEYDEAFKIISEHNKSTTNDNKSEKSEG